MGPKRGRSTGLSSSSSSSSSMDQPLLPQATSDHEWWANDENHQERRVVVGAAARPAVNDNDERGLRRSLIVDEDPITTFGEPSSFPRGDDDDNEFEFGGRGETHFGPPPLPPSRLPDGDGDGEGPVTDEEHRPVLMALYRGILALGVVVNAVLGVLLLISVVADEVKEQRPKHDAPRLGEGVAPPRPYIHFLHNSSSSNGEGDGDGNDAGNGTVWIATMLVLSAAHGLAVIATIAAVVGVTNTTGGEDASLGARNGEVLIVTNSGDDHGDQVGNTCACLCCCCSCCCVGEGSSRDRGRQRQLCGSCASVCLSVLLLIVYLALSVMAALGHITSNQVGEVLVIAVPDVIKSHLAVSFLIVATVFVVQSRIAFLYRHQIRLLWWSERGDERSRRRDLRRRRRRRRPWWWQSSSSWEPEPHDRLEAEVVPEVSDGWFGFLRRQGRKSSGSVPLLSRWGGGNPRDDGSVDFASVQEEWMNRSMEDPHWWSRDDNDWASTSAARSPAPRTKDWDGSSTIKRVPP